MSELLQLLYKKEKELLKSLEYVQGTISIFGGVHEPQIKAAPVGNLKGTTDILPLCPAIKNSVKRPQTNALKIPAKWDTDMTWKTKLMFLLNEIKEGTLSDLIDTLLKYEPKEDRKKATQRIANQCNILKKSHLIEYKQKGDKKKYYSLPG